MTAIRTRRIDANLLRFTLDEAGDGDNVALFLHGFPESRIAWRAQLPALAQLGWHAVAPDLRGYGETSRPAGLEPYRIQHLVDDVAAIYDALGARRRLLIAHDWGGVIAWQVAIRKRVPLDGLVILNAPHPNVFARVAANGWRQRFRSWYVLFFQLPWLPEASVARNGGKALARIFESHTKNFTKETLDIYARNISAPGAATAMINYYRANALELGRRKQPNGQIDVPTLMIWGENDVALDIALTEGNEEFVRDFTLHKLPGVSHWVQEDASPQVNALIEAWMQTKGLV